MAAQFESQTVVEVTTDSIALTKPTGTVEGDLLIVAIHARDTKGSTAPDGSWTKIASDEDNGGAGVDLGVFWKLAGASEGSSYTFTTPDAGSGSAAIQRYSGADGTAPIDVVSAVDTAADDTPIAPSVSPTTDDGLLVCIVGQRAADDNSFTPPGSMTEHYDEGTSLGGGTSADEVLTASGATGTRTFSSVVSNDWFAVSLVIAPAAAGGTTGTGVATLTSMAAAATAVLQAQGTGALSVQAVAASATGEEIIAGTADQTLASPLASVTGEQVTAPVGTGVQTLASILGAATGQQAFIGDAASVLASLVADALAEHSPPGASGTAVQTLPAAESGASGETDAQRVSPDTVEASSNLQDTLSNSPPTRLADIDEKTSADDGEWWTAINASEPIDVRAGFPAPASPLSGTQTIKARLRKTAGTPDPTVDLELWENGSFVKTLVSGTAITATDPGQVVSGTFDPTDVNDPARVELRIVSTPGSV